MLTIFSIPKPFRGHIGVIQSNAIQSWTLLHPACKVILFGNEEGTAEMATQYKVQYIPEVERNEYGTPLLNYMFKKAQQITSNQILCYVNADIILMSDFLKAIERVKRCSFFFLGKPFLLVGQRWNVDINEAWDFSASNWKTRLRDYVLRTGSLASVSAIDYFVFTRGLLEDMPPFAVGRPAWDNWVIYLARSLGYPVINATSAIIAVHQNHDYSHNTNGKTGVYQGPEARHNLELAGGLDHCYSLVDATWTLTPRWLRPAWGRISRQRKKQTEAFLSKERLKTKQ